MNKLLKDEYLKIGGKYIDSIETVPSNTARHNGEHDILVTYRFEESGDMSRFIIGVGKIFPQEANDPIFPDADIARWVNKYQPPKRTDGLSQDELRELQLKHSCSMLRELLEQKQLSEEQKLEENTRNCGEYSKTKEHYENMVAIQRVMTLI